MNGSNRTVCIQAQVMRYCNSWLANPDDCGELMTAGANCKFSPLTAEWDYRSSRSSRPELLILTTFARTCDW